MTIAAYLLAFVTTVLRRPKAGHILYLLGFAIAVCSFGYRWYHVRHVPLQNLFEVFLCLGMIYPVSLFCRRALRVGGYAADMLIGAIVLFPAGFVFNAEPQQLPPALQSWLFTPHVAVYMFSYIFMAKATFQAFCQLAGRNPKPGENLLPPEQATYRIICIGFPLLTLGLFLGSYWGKLAWGDYWGWDPKELWSLVSWLVFLGYFHFLDLGSLTVLVVEIALHLHEVDYALELVLRADRELYDDRVGPEPVYHALYAYQKIRADPVHLVHKSYSRDIVLVRLAPDRL